MIKRDWLERGIYTKWDVLDCNRMPFSRENFEEKYNIKTEFLRYRELPMYDPLTPCNSYLNITLSLDHKGVSSIYKMILGRQNVYWKM